MKTGLCLTFFGMVQGVGFRPFVAETAEKYKLTGSVKNSGGIVAAEVYGEREAVSAFLLSVRENPPAGARIDRIETSLWAPMDEPEDFRIIRSEDRTDAVRFLPPDLPVCDECTRELLDISNRRFRYPFISCTSCGPRYTIMQEVPYDRASTTMQIFPMCPSCASEYTEAGGRRRHAQTISCKDCGPVLAAYYREGKNGQGDAAGIPRTGRVTESSTGTSGGICLSTGESALEGAISCLNDGGIIAVRDIGGFHLAFRADCMEAAERLRTWKHREEKPFAVMFPDLEGIRKYCIVSETEEELLKSNPRPIVLLKQKDRSLWPEVSCHSDRMGAFLHCSPLQILLLAECGPLVMTSGNRGGGVIETQADLFLESMRTVDFPDLVLTHDRDILTPLDDSIYQVVQVRTDSSADPAAAFSAPDDGGTSAAAAENGHHEVIQILRRARGIVPEAIRLPRKLPGDCFAAGGDLKNVFAFGREDYVWAGGHYGDLEEAACREAREAGIEHLGILLGFEHIDHSVGDLHPRYYSTQGVERKFQHHLCHAMSVAAESGVTGRVLGISFDGTGFGTDGTIWGSEFLDIHIPESGMGVPFQSMAEGPSGNESPADIMTWHRAGHLSSFPLQGGDEGARDAKKTADSMMRQFRRQAAARQQEGSQRLLLSGNDSGANIFVTEIPAFYSLEEEKILEAADRLGLNEVSCTSMGRLFDAAAFLLGIADYNHYEGECPVLMEIEAHKYEDACLAGSTRKAGKYQGVAPATLPPDLSITIEKTADGCLVGNPLPMLLSLYRRKAAGEDASELAYFFHLAVADWTVAMADALTPPFVPVLLSGGTFLNRLLTDEVIRRLEAEGRQVFLNRLVPPGDGGLFLGQMYLLTFAGVEEAWEWR
ncbi:MAG: Sua5/YciO/YrdC/YwlC family protein [Lachnospiraceae bacterium]|nr:Sua5/YciO/YrdC/YwlC family protein [Lachnospiraceae bacterium]